MWKLTGSCLNIIAKCCSIINYGSIINSSFVNGIIAFFTKIFVIFSEGKNFLSHPQTIKKKLLSHHLTTFHFLSVFKVSDQMPLITSLTYGTAQEVRGRRIYLFILHMPLNSANLFFGHLVAESSEDGIKLHSTSKNELFSITVQCQLKHWVFIRTERIDKKAILLDMNHYYSLISLHLFLANFIMRNYFCCCCVV